jgi:hypothetical protein
LTLATPGARTGALEAIERILNRESEADVILRAAVAALAERLGTRWAAIAFVEEGDLVPGPLAGDPPGEPTRPAVAAPVEYRHALVAEIWLDHDGRPDADDQAFLRRVADLLSPYCLVGWDTGGEEWDV